MTDDDLSYELIDHLRNLCVGVAKLATYTSNLIGTNIATEVIKDAGALSEYLDTVESRKDLGDDD